MNGGQRHGVATYTATRHDQVAAVRDLDGLILVQLGSALDRHQFMLTVNAAALLARELLTAVPADHAVELDREF